MSHRILKITRNISSFCLISYNLLLPITNPEKKGNNKRIQNENQASVTKESD